jgi:hypothetical protein
LIIIQLYNNGLCNLRRADSGNKKARDFCLGLNAAFYCFLLNGRATKPDGWLKYDEYDDGGY